MNKAFGTLAVLGGGALFLTLATGVGVMSYNNSCVAQENGLEATWRDSQVQYDKFWKTVKEQAQITDKYASDFKEVFLNSIDGRYKGKDPTMQFLMEANPALSPKMYEQLARTVEAGRNDFSRTQRTLVDRQREYKTSLQKFPGSLVAGTLGFPSVRTGKWAPPNDADGDGMVTVLDYETITSGKTDAVFQSGREDEPLDIFSRQQAHQAGHEQGLEHQSVGE